MSSMVSLRLASISQRGLLAPPYAGLSAWKFHEPESEVRRSKASNETGTATQVSGIYRTANSHDATGGRPGLRSVFDCIVIGVHSFSS